MHVTFTAITHKTSNFNTAWRSVFEPSDNIVRYQRHRESNLCFLCCTYFHNSYVRAAVVSLSGPGGVVLRRFDYMTGQLILEKRLQALHQSPQDAGDFGDGTAIAFVEGPQDIVALTSGHTVQRIEGTGRVSWVWESPDKT